MQGWLTRLRCRITGTPTTEEVVEATGRIREEYTRAREQQFQLEFAYAKAFFAEADRKRKRLVARRSPKWRKWRLSEASKKRSGGIPSVWPYGAYQQQMAASQGLSPYFGYRNSLGNAFGLTGMLGGSNG